MTKRDYSYCDVHDWWTGAADVPCPHCVELNNLRAELRWCDAERRLALRALAEYAPVCTECADEYAYGKIEGHDVRLATWNVLLQDTCDAHAPPGATPLVYAAQIAAADEETR